MNYNQFIIEPSLNYYCRIILNFIIELSLNYNQFIIELLLNCYWIIID